MKKLFWILLTCQVLTSCHVGKKYCENNFPPTPYDSIVVKDSIIHDTVTVTVPAQELYFETESPCPPQTVYNKEIKKDGKTLTIAIKDGKITGKCNDDSLKILLAKERHEKTIIQSRQAVKEKEVKTIPWWAYVCAFLVAVLLITNITTYLVLRKK